MKRNFHYAETKAQKQATWMQVFNEKITESAPEHTGKIDWNSANHFFFKNMNALDAADLYVSNRKAQ